VIAVVASLAVASVAVVASLAMVAIVAVILIATLVASQNNPVGWALTVVRTIQDRLNQTNAGQVGNAPFKSHVFDELGDNPTFGQVQNYLIRQAQNRLEGRPVSGVVQARAVQGTLVLADGTRWDEVVRGITAGFAPSVQITPGSLPVEQVLSGGQPVVGVVETIHAVSTSDVAAAVVHAVPVVHLVK
jgi:hypothetical protein